MGTDDAKPKAKKGRSPIFLLIAVFTMAVGIFAFWPFIIAFQNWPSLIHVHAVVMAGWLSIFLGQVYFAYRGDIKTHIKLGKVALWYTIPIVIVGIMVGYHKVARVAKAGGRVDSARVHFMGSFIHFLSFGLCLGLGYINRSRKDIHRAFMVYANASLLPPAGGRLIGNWGFSPGLGLGLLPCATMVASLLYECLRGTWRSAGLNVVLIVFVIWGMWYEVEGSQAPWFAEFTDKAIAMDLMPWLGTTTYGNINEEIPGQ